MSPHSNGFLKMDHVAPANKSTLPLVSVLIPSYNHSLYITECLNSVIAETYPNIEIIIIDDGSTDNSYDIALRWAKDNTQTFNSVTIEKQINLGLTSTLNRLLRIAGGKYVVLLASDDILLSGGIQARAEFLEANPSLLAVFGDCIAIDNAGNPIHRSTLVDRYGADKEALKHRETIETELIWRWSVPGPVLMVRRDTYFDSHGIGPYPEELSVEDRYFYLAALARKGLGFVDFPVSGYRIHQTQSIANRQSNISDDRIRAELMFIGRLSAPSSLALWLQSRDIYLKEDTLRNRILKFMLWRIGKFIGRLVLHFNSNHARILSSSNSQPH